MAEVIWELLCLCTHVSVSEHGQKVFAITSSFLAISSIFRNLAKMKEFKEDEGKLLGVLHSARRRRKHARIQALVEKTFAFYTANGGDSEWATFEVVLKAFANRCEIRRKLRHFLLLFPFQFFQLEVSRDQRERPRRISRVFCLFRVNSLPSILFILLNRTEQNDIPFIPKTE